MNSFGGMKKLWILGGGRGGLSHCWTNIGGHFYTF